MKKNLQKNNSGYSMIVLVIAVVVIIILGSVSISSLRTSRERREMLNFIFDLNTMEDKVQNYYVEKGTLPTSSKQAIDIYSLANKLDSPETFLSQLSQYDNENYYIIDLSQLKGLSLRESFRGIDSLKAANPEDNGYIVNEASLKVYVEKGIKYTIPGEKTGNTFYTLTSNLVNGQERYEPQDEDVIVVGNPQTWVSEASIRIVLPRHSLVQSEWDNWTFKWDFGPKTIEEMEKIPNDENNVKNFKYGDKLVVKSNGIYTIYVYNPDTKKATLTNVNVSKIDDVIPKFLFEKGGNLLNVEDAETGIKEVKFKKLSEYQLNVQQAMEEAASGGDEHSESRTKVDYYLMDGKGSDVIYELSAQIAEYLSERQRIQANIAEENDRYDRWNEENPVDGVTVLQEEADQMTRAHNAYVQEYNRQISELDSKYSYLRDVEGSTGESRLVIYIEDYAGNATVVGDQDFISTKIVADSFSIEIKKLVDYLATL